MSLEQFVAESHLRGEFSAPERASYYQFRTSAGKTLTVAWHTGRWACVYWLTGAPVQPADDPEAQDMREAEQRATQMWAERQQANQARHALRLVA